MNDLEQERMRRLENHVNALTVQIRLANIDLCDLSEEIADWYDRNSPRSEGFRQKAIAIQARIEALNSLTSRDHE